jgi:hypothetical protein
MYYGIYKDEIKYQVVSIEEQEFSKNNTSLYLYIVKRIEYETQGGYNTVNYGFIYEVYDNKLNRACIEINGWKTASKFQTFAAWSIVTKYIENLEIIDTDGKIQIVPRVENSLEAVIHLLLTLSNYKTWLNYDLYKETVELKKEVTQLKSQINELELSQKDNTELKVENLRLKEEFATMQFIENENKLLKKKLNEISSIIFSDVKEDNNDIVTNS